MRKIIGISLVAGALALFAAQPALAQHHGGGHGGGHGGHSSGWHGGSSHGSWHGGNWSGNWYGGRGWYGYGYRPYYAYRTWWPGYYSGYYYPSYGYSYPYDSGYYDYAYPSYGGYSSAYPSTTTIVRQPPAVNVNTAQVVVRLPDANGEVWFDGQKMNGQTGAARSYTTPPLEPGRTYSYQVSAAWHQNGRLVTQERTVNVSAGSAVAVDFGQSATLPAPIGQ